MSHHTREILSSRHPVLITLRTKPELGSLRRPRVHAVIRGALIECCDGGAFRICHYALQKHGILLLIEARDRQALSRGMQGVNVRMAKALNRLWQRNGSVFSDRYETDVIKTGQRGREVLCHLLNHARLGGRMPAGELDPFSSAIYFDGWKNLPAPAPRPPGGAPVARPRTSLLKTEWRKHGLIDVNEVPVRRAAPGPGAAAS